MPEKSQEKTLILASSSPYRREQLSRLGIAFSTVSPSIDETAQAGEAITDLVARLARDKAAAVTLQHPGSVVIGCDQLALCEGRIVGKPGNRENADAQLASFSGKTVEFLSALCVIDDSTSRRFSDVVPTYAVFRNLAHEEIARYIDIDNPIDCAGSFKSESAGISLLRSMDSSDPTAIIGLPLIALSQMLRECGFKVP